LTLVLLGNERTNAHKTVQQKTIMCSNYGTLQEQGQYETKIPQVNLFTHG